MKDKFMTAEEKLPPRTFGLKDIFTCINLLGGVIAIIFCIHGRPDYASYSILLGYICGDALDGFVARLTNTGNTFGAEFDSISDHLTQCVAPAAIVYSFYQDTSVYLAGALASLLIITGSIRHARSTTVSTHFPGAYMGLPRTISSFLIIAFLNSGLLIVIPGFLWVGVGLLVLVSAAHLMPLPFRTHKSGQKGFEKLLALSFFSMTILALILIRPYTFDIVFAWIFIYTVFSWSALEPHEMKAFFARAKEWSLAIRRAR
jgi:phosphatidylserine synthase